MPCATVHLMLAGRVWDAWSLDPSSAPVPVDSPAIFEAFLHGALAPDMGFIPGADRFVSELSHYVTPADLARALVRFASEESQLAFAWGWVTHVLGDIALHPVVGRACGELLHGDRRRRLNASEDVFTHVSLEVGLDVMVLSGDPSIPRPPRSPGFDRRSIRYLTGALQEAYGIPWNDEAVLASHRRAVWLTARWPNALSLLARGHNVFLVRRKGYLCNAAVRAGLTLASRLARWTSKPAQGFLTPRRPAGWVLEEVDGYADGFVDLFRRHQASGLENLRNQNLETGVEEGCGEPHPGAEHARTKLEAERRSRTVRLRA